MSDGKNIEIKIAATGGDQAAAEVRKVETAADNLSGGRGTGKGLKAIQEESQKVTAANVKMGTGFQNVGYQVQDLAVQISSGTSAFRALAQQAPQLLSGFGPVGITLGTVAAVALPLAGAMFNLGDATQTAGEKADEAADKLEKLADKRAKKATEESAQEYRQFIAALDDETIAYKRQNDEIQRTIDLLQAKRRAQAEIDSADAALALAKIDASDAPETEKIKQRAKVQEDLERKRFEDRKAEAGDRVNAAYNRATGATGDATLKRSEEDAAKQRLAEQEAEARALKNRVNAADQAKANLPKVESDIADKRQQIAGKEAGIAPNATEINALKKELESLEQRRNALANESGGVSAGDRQRLEELQGKDGLGGSNAELKKSIEALTSAAEKLEEAARKAQGDYQGTRAVETEKLGGDFEATKRRLETGRITSGTAAERAAAEAKRKADQQAANDERDRLRGDLSGSEQGLNDAARGQGLGMRKTKGAERNATYKQVESALLDGTNSGELQKLGDMVREANGKNGAAITGFLLQIIDGLNTQAKEMETLRQQLKNKK
jgi:hypothetical protein